MTGVQVRKLEETLSYCCSGVQDRSNDRTNILTNFILRSSEVFPALPFVLRLETCKS